MVSIKQCYSIYSFLILICTQLIISTLQWPIDDIGCRTPDGGVGSCVLIKKCEPITTFQNSVPSTPETMETIKSYYCGVEDNIYFKVCCPHKPNITSLVSTKPRSLTTVEPPDVTNHKNVNLLPFNCGLQLGGPRITGGNNAALLEFPWMALLSYETRKGQAFRCGGTIINERYILTAAHCITQLDPVKLIGVRVGEYNISSGRDCENDLFEDDYCAPSVQEFFIDEVIPHPLYDCKTYTSDIGLIRLAAPIDLTADSTKTICLPVEHEVRNKNLDDFMLTVTGWGAAENGRKLDVLQKVNLPIVLEESCHKAYEKTTVVIDDKQICAGGNRRGDPCGGDSGGPLQMSLRYHNDVRFVQFGVISYGPRFCGRPEGLPSVHTRIDHYMNWILDNIKP